MSLGVEWIPSLLMILQRWFDAVGHYSREDVLAGERLEFMDALE